MKNTVWGVLLVVLLAGCATQSDFTAPVVLAEESMEFLEPGLRPEVLLFPDYFLMEDFELKQHGKIPGSPLIGGGLKTPLALTVVRSRFNDALATHEWEIDTVEIGKNSFRIKASFNGEALEVRAVQGAGPTQVFLLYHPPQENEVSSID